MMTYVRLAIAAGVVAFLAFTHHMAHQFGADGVRLEVSMQALKQIERAQDETRKIQEAVNEAQQQYNQAIAGIREFERRPTAGQLRHQELAARAARADADRLRALAAQAERDLEWTEAERSRFGVEAAEASAVAHALNNQKSNPSRPTPPTRPIQP